MKIPFNLARSFLLTIGIFTVVGCASIKTGTHTDQSVSINQYKTFSWITDDPMIIYSQKSMIVSPITKKYIKNSIVAALVNKGYQYLPTSTEADFVLSFSVGTREKMDMDYYPRSYRGHWDWYWQGDFHNTENWHVRTWTEGTLMIDIFDEQSKEPVWHGWATKVVTEKDRQKPSESINKAVTGIFEEFPVSMKQ